MINKFSTHGNPFHLMNPGNFFLIKLVHDFIFGLFVKSSAIVLASYWLHRLTSLDKQVNVFNYILLTGRIVSRLIAL